MEYKYWLSNLMGISAREKRKLLELAGTEESLYKMPEYQLQKLHMIQEKSKEILVLGRKEENWKIRFEHFQKSGVKLLTYYDQTYPDSLKQIYDPPFSLYVKGKVPPQKQKLAAIVGARDCSDYGQTAAEVIGRELAAAGWGIVSGLAYGIDASSHSGALKAQGDTYAIMGCGVDVCYPKRNFCLYERIAETGGIISEFPMGCEPRRNLFPMRNRIISGLSDVVIVVEARKRSGSFITVDCALEQGKSVYAVPGRISDSLSYGTNWLLSQGAGVFYSVEEFLKEYGYAKEKTDSSKKNIEIILEKNEMLVYSVLDLTPKHPELLIEETGLGMNEVLQALYELKKRGYIKETYKNYYIKSGFDS